MVRLYRSRRNVLNDCFSFVRILVVFITVALWTQTADALCDSLLDKRSHWIEGTQALDNGATRDYYNRRAFLAWDNLLGDWEDANGIAQGEAAYGTTLLIDDNTPEYIEWDVTTLVREWLHCSYPNKGFLIRKLSGSGTFKFYSREHAVPSQRPELFIVSPDGTHTLAPEADVYLSASTYQGKGDSTLLELTDGRNILVRFDLSALNSETEVTHATLRLYVYEEYGSASLEAGVFRCAQGHELPPSEPILGLAAQYPNDQGLETHSDVYLFSDFETSAWGADWTSGAGGSTIERVASDPARQFVPFQGTALRAEILEGAHLGMNLEYTFADEVGQEPEEIYFRYYLRFSDDWETPGRGKMPGFGGTYDRAGWGGRQSDGTNGWSARGYFATVQGGAFGEAIPLGHYVYHADMLDHSGDGVFWQKDYRGFVKKNQWYSVEQYLRMNTPGQNDGILRVWVDGRLAYEKEDWRWRDIASLKIEKIWMNVYHGGLDVADKDVHLYIDNVVIAKQYIGPMASNSNVSEGLIFKRDSSVIWRISSTGTPVLLP